jgi:hypothetical protein
MAPPESYDAVVIGSSPLMLLVALEEREAGKQVCIVDKADAIGGVWRTVKISDSLEVEYACHLVEDFPGVYEYLERASGVAFTALDVQPIRVLRNGFRFRYSSRATLLLATVWAVSMMLRQWLKGLFGRVSEADRERLIVLKQKVRDFVRYHKGLLIYGSTVKAPTHGYAEFIRSLRMQCDRRGIFFRKFDVISARDDGRAWNLGDGAGNTIQAMEIHSTTSASLTKTRDNEFIAHSTHETVTRSILVEVPTAHTKTRVSYAAFWKDPEVVRVSRIDQREPRRSGSLYLVQLGKGGATAGLSSLAVVQRCLRQCGVLSADGAASIVDEIHCSRIPHDRQLAPGLVGRNFRTYSSAGNLASGVAQWLSARRSASPL